MRLARRVQSISVMPVVACDRQAFDAAATHRRAAATWINTG
jgi:hypothetical protein